jgi:hypothetical protein
VAFTILVKVFAWMNTLELKIIPPAAHRVVSWLDEKKVVSWHCMLKEEGKK